MGVREGLSKGGNRRNACRFKDAVGTAKSAIITANNRKAVR